MRPVHPANFTPPSFTTLSGSFPCARNEPAKSPSPATVIARIFIQPPEEVFGKKCGSVLRISIVRTRKPFLNALRKRQAPRKARRGRGEGFSPRSEERRVGKECR